jgi:FlaA1/EpsC-like NDP-sugar epimerase
VQLDIRAARPYLLSRSPLKTFGRRVASITALVVIDLSGLVIGLYLALALRSEIRDPKPILWNLLWDHETEWLPFLILLLLLVFSRSGLYSRRELREGVGRIAQSVFLVAALSLAFAIGTGQHFTTFGLYVASAFFVAALISVFRWSYETVTGSLLRSFGVRRKALLVGEPEQVARLQQNLGASRGGIDYEFTGAVLPGPALHEELARQRLDELIVADAGLDEQELLEIVETAHRHAVRVRVAPRTKDLLVERDE